MNHEKYRQVDEKSVSAIAPTGVAQKFADERGLYLYGSQHGTKSWRYDYWVGGKRATLTLGKYPDISLANARKKTSRSQNNHCQWWSPSPGKEDKKVGASGCPWQYL